MSGFSRRRRHPNHRAAPPRGTNTTGDVALGALVLALTALVFGAMGWVRGAPIAITAFGIFAACVLVLAYLDRRGGPR